MKLPTPTHRERIALFRLGVIGDLLTRELARGELSEELRVRSQRRYRPPGARQTRTYSAKTLQRWYLAAKKDHVAALQPVSRARGAAQQLNQAQRELLLEMRRENPSASVELILAEAVRHKVFGEGAVSKSTVTRLFRDANLPRASKKRAGRKQDVQRRRWQVKRPGDLWHADVCHVVLSDGQGARRKVLVHGFLDDTSRLFTALEVREQETERDMLEVLCGALLEHAPPKTLYLDNGSCYRGQVLALVCKRLSINLVHAPPYSPENRGKMERVWRTMRQRCTDHLPAHSSLREVQLALWAWLDADYHRRPHGSLMGMSPLKRYDGGPDRRPLSPKELAQALEVTLRRRVRKDGTFNLDGVLYEAAGRHIVGKWLELVIDGLQGGIIRASYQGTPVRFGHCDPVANRRRKRPESEAVTPTPQTLFNPVAALLQQARELGDE